MGSISINKQMHAQENGSCGVQDWKNKCYIYSCCVYSCSEIYFGAIPLCTSRCMHSKVDVVACRIAKINTTFTGAVSIHVP